MKWNVTLYGLLFSGLGAFSYLLLANYSDLSPHVADMLFSKGAFIFFITAFNILGCSTLRLSSWLNSQYALNIRKTLENYYHLYSRNSPVLSFEL